MMKINLGMKRAHMELTIIAVIVVIMLIIAVVGAAYGHFVITKVFCGVDCPWEDIYPEFIATAIYNRYKTDKCYYYGATNSPWQGDEFPLTFEDGSHVFTTPNGTVCQVCLEWGDCRK